MSCEPIDDGIGRRSALSTSSRRSAICYCGSRRAFLRALGTFGSATVLPAPPVWAQAASAPAHRIDVHHHFFPQFLLEAWQKAGVRP